MRIVFMGTPEFAVPSLKALCDAGYDVVGVFTQPDRPKGRGNKVIDSHSSSSSGICPSISSGVSSRSITSM